MTWKRILGIASALLLTAAVEGQAGYTITSLGTLGGSSSFGQAINNSGDVVGTSSVAGDSVEHAFLYSNGTLTDINDPDNVVDGWILSDATAINDAGQIVAELRHGGVSYTAIYSNPTQTALVIGADSLGYGINNSGDVVGTMYVGQHSAYHAFHYSGFSMTNLNDPGYLNLGWALTKASAINDAGQIVADLLLNGNSFAVILSNQGLHFTGIRSQGTAINAFGDIVGGMPVNDFADYHAFLYSKQTMTDLGTLGGTYSTAYGINASGQVVGDSLTAANSRIHAFLYENGTMTDLNDLLPANSGWELFEARGINNRGQIVGTGYLNGEVRAFLMTPDAPSGTAPVPEPSSLALLAIGGVFISSRLRRTFRPDPSSGTQRHG